MRRFLREQANNLIVLLLLLLFLVVFFAHRIFIFVEAGEAGVFFRRLFGGVVTTRVYDEGLHLIFPWDSMTVYNVRIQEKSTEFTVISSNGLPVNVQISARFHPYRTALPLLHKRIGPGYIDTIVVPVVESSVRRAIGEHTADDLYANKGPVLYKINNLAGAELGESFIALDGLVIKRIKLPKFIESAIETKEEQRELLDAYTYRLRREKQEAYRKEIEAVGWQNFNSIVGQSLSPRLLQWRGIEATRELAASNNTKVVIMGNNERSLPVILGSDYTAGGANPNATASPKTDIMPMSQLDARLRETDKLFEKLLKANNPNAPTASPSPATSPSPVASPTPANGTLTP